jgi:hypothetical protein
MITQQGEACGKEQLTKGRSAAKILPLQKLPHWRPTHSALGRSSSGIGSKPAHELVYKVARSRTRSLSQRAQRRGRELSTMGRRALRSSLARDIQQLHPILIEQLGQEPHLYENQMVERIAARFPKYKSVINVIPTLATCMPESLRREFAVKAQSNTFRIGFFLLKRWLQ